MQIERNTKGVDDLFTTVTSTKSILDTIEAHIYPLAPIGATKRTPAKTVNITLSNSHYKPLA